MPKPFHLRPAAACDLDAMARMSRDYIEFGLPWRWRGEKLKACQEADDKLVLGAYKGPRPVGFSVMEFGLHDAHLLLLAVMPRHRREGIAQAMLDWLERSMRTMGHSRIFVQLRTQNHGALRFYQQAGFHLRGELSRYYDGIEDAYLMVREFGSAPIDGTGAWFEGPAETELARWFRPGGEMPPQFPEKS